MQIQYPALILQVTMGTQTPKFGLMGRGDPPMRWGSDGDQPGGITTV